MLRMSRKQMFALEAVLDIAYYAGNQPVQSAIITARQGIPKRYLEQVLQELVRAGILAGVRGPRGGYRLARERRRISVGEILRVVRQLENSGGESESESPASALGAQVVRPLWQSQQAEIMTRLDAITIEDLCTQAADLGIPGKAMDGIDFTI